MHPNVHSSTIYNSQVLEATEVPISKRVDAKTMVYLHNGILRSREKEGAYTLCNSMDGTGEHYAKRNIPVREKINTTGFHIHVESNKQNKLTK